MRMSNKETAREVVHRMAALRERNKNRLRRVLTISAALCFALLACVAVLPNLQQTEQVRTTQGSALELVAGPTAGGYVLVGVLCFALGIVFVLACLRAKGRGKKK